MPRSATAASRRAWVAEEEILDRWDALNRFPVVFGSILPHSGLGVPHNALERVQKEMKPRLKRTEQFPKEGGTEKYRYAILRAMNESFLNRRLRKWKYCRTIYQEKTRQQSTGDTDTMTRIQPVHFVRVRKN